MSNHQMPKHPTKTGRKVQPRARKLDPRRQKADQAPGPNPAQQPDVKRRSRPPSPHRPLADPRRGFGDRAFGRGDTPSALAPAISLRPWSRDHASIDFKHRAAIATNHGSRLNRPVICRKLPGAVLDKGVEVQTNSRRQLTPLSRSAEDSRNSTASRRDFRTDHCKVIQRALTLAVLC